MTEDILNEVLNCIKNRKSVLVYGGADSGKTRLLKYLSISIKNSLYIYPSSSKRFIELLCSKLGIKAGKSIIDSFNLCINELMKTPGFVLIADDFYEFDKRTRKVIWKLSKSCTFVASSYSKTKGFDFCVCTGKAPVFDKSMLNPYNLMLAANIMILLRYICYLNNEYRMGYIVSTLGYMLMLGYRMSRNRKNK